MRVIPVLAVLLALALSGASAHAQGEEIEVEIEDFAFNPPNITVHVGDTVVWENYDVGIPHNAHALDGTFETEVVEGTADGVVSGSYTFTADDVGTHEYKCDVHPNMRGTVTVLAADEGDDGQGGDDQSGDDQQTDQDDDAPMEMPDTGAGGMATGGGLPVAPMSAMISLLAAGAYALIRRR